MDRQKGHKEFRKENRHTQKKRKAVHVNTEPPGPVLLEVNKKENELMINRTILAF